MEKDILKTKHSFDKKNNLPNASVRTFDLPTLIKKMKHSQDWVTGGFNSIILVKSHDNQIVLAALHEGTEINSNHLNDSITFQIIEGELELQTHRKTVILDKGQLLTVNKNTKYSITIWEETILLLTIANDS